MPWECASCTLKNDDVTVSCALCERPRAIGDLPAITSGTPDPRAPLRAVDAALLVTLPAPLLGEGSYGRVHYGTYDGAEVAVKVLQLDARDAPATVVRGFRREAQLLGELAHPNILPLWGVVDADHGVGGGGAPPTLSLVVGLAEGGSLEGALRGGAAPAPLPPAAARRVALGVARALVYLHSRPDPVAHNDLKSGNVLLDGKGDALLADFGVSRAVGGTLKHTHCATATAREDRGEVGTVAWMAPENADPEDANYLKPSADMYSFGMLLFEVTTGCPPWEGLNMGQIRAAVRCGRRPPLPAGADAELAGLITACWAQDPTARPTAAAALARLAAMEWGRGGGERAAPGAAWVQRLREARMAAGRALPLPPPAAEAPLSAAVDAARVVALLDAGSTADAAGVARAGAAALADSALSAEIKKGAALVAAAEAGDLTMLNMALVQQGHDPLAPASLTRAAMHASLRHVDCEKACEHVSIINVLLEKGADFNTAGCWKAARDTQGRTYYYDPLTQATTWHAPSWWVEHTDLTTGKSYYVNAGTGVTQWHPPPTVATPRAGSALSLRDLRDVFDVYVIGAHAPTVAMRLLGLEKLRNDGRCRIEKQMDSSTFLRFVSECPGLLGGGVSRAEAEVIFARTKPRAARRLDFDNFLDALLAVAERKFPAHARPDALQALMDAHLRPHFELLTRGAGGLAPGGREGTAQGAQQLQQQLAASGRSPRAGGPSPRAGGPLPRAEGAPRRAAAGERHAAAGERHADASDRHSDAAAAQRAFKAAQAEKERRAAEAAHAAERKHAADERAAEVVRAADAARRAEAMRAAEAAEVARAAEAVPAAEVAPFEPVSIAPLGARTLADAQHEECAARGGLLATGERARRAAALAAMRAAAEASPPGSPLRAHWDDFQAATAAVEAKRAEVRRGGPGARFRDGWSGTPEALGKGLKQCEWADMADLCEAPVVCDGGFVLSDVQQGSVGDCYFVSCLAELVSGEFGGLGDVQQGALGTCYMLAAAAVLAGGGGGGGGGASGGGASGNGASGGGTSGDGAGGGAGGGPGLLDTIFVTTEPNLEGVYCVRFWIDGAWQWFFMDTLFLCSRGVYREAADVGLDGKDPVHWVGKPNPSKGRFRHLFAVKSKPPGRMWAPFLEKAWAMLHGSYADSEGTRGNSKRPPGVAMSTAFPLNFFVAHSLPGYAFSTAEAVAKGGVAELWRELVEAFIAGYLMTASVSEATPTSPVVGSSGADKDGIVRKHAYSVLRVLHAAGQPRLLKLRNPWGHREWTGAYSDSNLASWTPALRAATGYSPEASGDDGVFWLSVEDFAHKFESLNVTPRIKLINEGGAWHKAVAAGVFTRADRIRAEGLRYPSNKLCFQQFLFRPLSAGQFYIFVMQRTGARRAPVHQISASLYLFSGADGTVPAAEADWYFYPPGTPRVRHVQGWRKGSGGLLQFNKVELSEGCYIVIPELEAVPGGNVDFEVAVVSKCAFELRVAAPGSARASDTGVVWVSGRP